MQNTSSIRLMEHIFVVGILVAMAILARFDLNPSETCAAGEVVQEVYLPGPVPRDGLTKAIEPHTYEFGSWAMLLDGKVEGPYWFTVTAYSQGDGHTPGTVTYSGLPVREGLTLACGPELEIGDMIILENGMRGVCLDRGGAITAGRLDIYFGDLEEAKAFGVQEMRGVVLR